MVWAYPALQQPHWNHHWGHLWGLVMLQSAEEMLDGQQLKGRCPWPCQNCSWWPPAEKTGRGCLPIHLSCPSDNPVGQGTELNWTVQWVDILYCLYSFWCLCCKSYKTLLQLQVSLLMGTAAIEGIGFCIRVLNHYVKHTCWKCWCLLRFFLLFLRVISSLYICHARPTQGSMLSCMHPRFCWNNGNKLKLCLLLTWTCC